MQGEMAEVHGDSKDVNKCADLSITIAQEFMRHMGMLHTFMESDLQSCDAKWTLFVAAVTSYRYDKLLNPCPKQYLNVYGMPDVERLYDAISEMPKLTIIKELITKCNYEEFRPRSMDLLYWVLVICRDPLLRTLLPDDYNTFYEHLHIGTPTKKPAHIFEVHPYENNQHLQHYNELRSRFATSVVYCGVPLDHVFSHIINNLLPSGEPLQLVSELDEAIKRSPISCGWGGSMCGSVIRCVLVGEVIRDPIHVDIRADPTCNANHIISVNDAHYLRISHMLFYGESCEELENMLNKNTMKDFVDRTKYFAMFVLYVMGVTALGIAIRRNGPITRLVRNALDSWAKIWASNL